MVVGVLLRRLEWDDEASTRAAHGESHDPEVLFAGIGESAVADRPAGCQFLEDFGCLELHPDLPSPPACLGPQNRIRPTLFPISGRSQ